MSSSSITRIVGKPTIKSLKRVSGRRPDERDLSAEEIVELPQDTKDGCGQEHANGGGRQGRTKQILALELCAEVDSWQAKNNGNSLESFACIKLMLSSAEKWKKGGIGYIKQAKQIEQSLSKQDSVMSEILQVSGFLCVNTSEDDTGILFTRGLLLFH
ncbi:hypothetical protein ZIOFF_012152 [Zingiber officinale]|uniref:Uncharacterized protein n=1 Tax=Zingiber officinale TaxID=94328 RepID=A0A8J5HS93_ZINOF|nr:hypothetical protein ZIOFF_012152 [Zingiber officinale]